MLQFPEDLLKAIILEWNILHFYNLVLLEIFKLFATFLCSLVGDKVSELKTQGA